VQGRSYEQLLRAALTASLILAAMVGAVTGARLDVDINIYPWSSIGKIGIASMTIRHACSGARAIRPPSNVGTEMRRDGALVRRLPLVGRGHPNEEAWTCKHQQRPRL
jgi:hypothetical protein